MLKNALFAVLAVGLTASMPVKHRAADATLTKVSITFNTHNDNKDHDTGLNVSVKSKVNLFLSKDIASGSNVGGDTEFEDPSSHTYDLTLNSSDIKVSDLTAPFIAVDIQPNGNDRWIFDYVVKLTFSDNNSYSSKAQGVVLDQDNRHYEGVFTN